MTGLLGFCAFMTFAYLPYDVFWKPVDKDQEVWLGFLVTGWAAKATEPLHWAIYGAGTYGFWKMRAWMHPWAALYTASVAVGMLVWALTDPRGPGLAGGLAAFAPFALLAFALWRRRAAFTTRAQVATG
jgi:hypothetical protein